MLYLISFSFSLIYVCQALHVSAFKGITSIGGYDRLQDNSSSLIESFLHSVSFTSGFLRTETSYRLDNQWVRAKVWPIGTCFKEEESGRSGKVAHVKFNSSHVVGLTYSYDAPHCTGRFFSVVFMLPIMQTHEEFTNVVSYVADTASALAIPSKISDGLIFS